MWVFLGACLNSWHRLHPKLKTVIKWTAVILLLEGLLWVVIFCGKGLQYVFWVRWEQAIVEIRPIQNVPFASIINQCGKDYNVDPALIAAVISCESSFNPRAVSQAGAVGLMQVCLPTWQEIKKTQVKWQKITGEKADIQMLYQPEINIEAGTLYLQFMLLRYRGDPVKAVAAYNAGPGSVDRYKGIPPYQETAHYVHHVASMWQKYRGLDDIAAACYAWGCTLEQTGLKIQTYILWCVGVIVWFIGIRCWMQRGTRRW